VQCPLRGFGGRRLRWPTLRPAGEVSHEAHKQNRPCGLGYLDCFGRYLTSWKMRTRLKVPYAKPSALHRPFPHVFWPNNPLGL